MLRSILAWLNGTKAARQDFAPAQLPAPKACPIRAVGITGKLTHKRIYTFGATQSGQSSTKCRICLEPGQHVFSRAVDEAGKEHRCCLRCLIRLGGREQAELAAKRSRYAKRVLECIDALDQLEAEFPNSARRPFGEKSLRMEIALPFMGYDGIERVIEKIKNRKWTAHDLAQIEGKSLNT